ncbi:hypothetical protein F2Q70_00025864 [Brassica cretica]|uniref:Lipin N-terminal domain-containing protein n=1 Tax=Brassica cretica TaxID=69181 RepID=A0A8S9L6E1_BRACR|nr:hypothetical protein F2Q70_00025864 [Brassica cretica]
MNAVGRIGSYIYRGVGTVSGPFHPFGGAIDIIVVEQPDGTFKSSPWYVRFGKFQGVLKNRRNLIKIEVNGVDSGFTMYLAHTGQAYFLREVEDVIGEAESGEVYTLSSGDEAETSRRKSSSDGVDKKIKIPLKSKSCNYDSASPRVVGGNGKIVGKPGILGFVFGGRSVKVDDDDGVTSMERAEIAADLLDVKWSTNIDTRKCVKGKASKSFDGTSLVDSDSILETPLVASPTLQYLDEKEQDFRESNNAEEDYSLLLVDNGSCSFLSDCISVGFFIHFGQKCFRFLLTVKPKNMEYGMGLTPCPFCDVGKFEYRVTEQSQKDCLTTNTHEACLPIHENSSSWVK